MKLQKADVVPPAILDWWSELLRRFPEVRVAAWVVRGVARDGDGSLPAWFPTILPRAVSLTRLLNEWLVIILQVERRPPGQTIFLASRTRA